MVEREREYVFAGVLVLVGLLAMAILWQVLATVFFAVTVAYVLFPLREWLVRRGIGTRPAAAICTVAAFLAVIALLVPLVVTVYVRRSQALAFLRRIPEQVTLSVYEFTYVVSIDSLVPTIRSWVTSVAVSFAQASPVIALKAFLFAILVYALLVRPRAVHRALLRIVPPTYQPDLLIVHERIRSTLNALYVLQAATAFATFLAGYVVFAILGYKSALGLAVVAGVLQFIPVVGPGILILVLAGLEVAAGDLSGAAMVTIVGLVLVGFLPDAVIRPRLASLTTGLPASLYFVGFTGGILSLGLVGFIAGPLAIAILAAVVDLLADERESRTRVPA